MKRAFGGLRRRPPAPGTGGDATEHGLRQLTRLTRKNLRAQTQLGDEVHSLREDVAGLRSELFETRQALMTGIRLAVDDEAGMRRRLHQARSAPDFQEPWDTTDPLVSVVIPTYTSWRLLRDRSLPSALAQTHRNLEVVVVGDAAPDETAAAIAELDDPRIRYENLAIRGPYPEERQARWFVAGTGPMNRAVQLAQGSWVAYLNDDDALRPDHVATLLKNARAHRTEVAYSKMLVHYPEGAEQQDFAFGSFPPVKGDFAWQIAMQHRAMSLFEFELGACLFNEPGDWHRTLRMLRAGVRFSQADAVTCDYFPNHIWDHQ